MTPRPMGAIMAIGAIGTIALTGCGAAAASPWAPASPIPSAFWAHTIPAERLIHFPHAPGFVAGCSIPMDGALRSIGIRSPTLNGMCMSQAQPPSQADLRWVPRARRHQAAETVTLSEAWGNGQAATFVFVISPIGVVLGEHVTGQPPQLYR